MVVEGKTSDPRTAAVGSLRWTVHRLPDGSRWERVECPADRPLCVYGGFTYFILYPAAAGQNAVMWTVDTAQGSCVRQPAVQQSEPLSVSPLVNIRTGYLPRAFTNQRPGSTPVYLGRVPDRMVPADAFATGGLTAAAPEGQYQFNVTEEFFPDGWSFQAAPPLGATAAPLRMRLVGTLSNGSQVRRCAGGHKSAWAMTGA